MVVPSLQTLWLVFMDQSLSMYFHLNLCSLLQKVRKRYE